MSCSRLPTLLRYFKLHSNATSSELRQVYLKRVKELHPDVSRQSCHDFLELQKNFQEASDLLARPAAPKEQVASTQPGQAWSGMAPDCSKAAPAVPVVGLPETNVYALGGMFLAGVSLLISQRSSAPAAAEYPAGNGSAAKSSPSASSSQRSSATYPELESGPWNVVAAKAVVPRKGIWSPGSTHEFLESDSFYAGRAKGHQRAGIGQRVRLGEKQGGQIKNMGYEASREPLIRRDIQMLPVHAAAEDGKVWWLEHCGASSSCRSMLNLADMHGDSPLHHGAWAGCMDSCMALLRLGAETDACNVDNQMPEELADQRGHKEVAELLRSARKEAYGEGDGPVARHPDGLGKMAEPPEGVIFTGLQASEILRHAVNMAVGCSIAPPLPISKSMKESENAAMRIVGVIRGCIQDTEFDLEDEVASFGGEAQAADFWTCLSGKEDMEACGMLIYEPPGQVSPDAPGHWAAIQKDRSSDTFWRLDPLRGPFQLTAAELDVLTKRYQAWLMIRRSQQVRQERTAKLHSSSKEAEDLVQSRYLKASSK